VLRQKKWWCDEKKVFHNQTTNDDIAMIIIFSLPRIFFFQDMHLALRPTTSITMHAPTLLVDPAMILSYDDFYGHQCGLRLPL
jgi:hypothetical protein